MILTPEQHGYTSGDAVPAFTAMFLAAANGDRVELQGGTVYPFSSRLVIDWHGVMDMGGATIQCMAGQANALEFSPASGVLGPLVLLHGILDGDEANQPADPTTMTHQGNRGVLTVANGSLVICDGQRIVNTVREGISLINPEDGRFLNGRASGGRVLAFSEFNLQSTYWKIRDSAAKKILATWRDLTAEDGSICIQWSSPQGQEFPGSEARISGLSGTGMGQDLIHIETVQRVDIQSVTMRQPGKFSGGDIRLGNGVEYADIRGVELYGGRLECGNANEARHIRVDSAYVDLWNEAEQMAQDETGIGPVTHCTNSFVNSPNGSGIQAQRISGCHVKSVKRWAYLSHDAFAFGGPYKGFSITDSVAESLGGGNAVKLRDPWSNRVAGLTTFEYGTDQATVVLQAGGATANVSDLTML